MAHRTTIRIPAALLAGGLLLTPLTGCTISSENVSCSTSSCTVRLSGDTSEVEILGTTLGFGGVQDGRASLEVAGTSVTCAEGEPVRAGTLILECTSVSDDSVEVTASLG